MRIDATVFATIGFVQAVSSGSAAVAQDSAVARPIDVYLSALARATQFSGTVLVGRGATIVFERSYGKADFRASAANAPSTLSAVASLTKPITGIAVRLLAARGVLSLDDPIAKWLPDFPRGHAITVAQLLSHRSGIPHRVTQRSDEEQPQTATSMTRLVSRAPFAFEPGAQRLYSSAGYSVLARVLELASGKSYAELVHELILVPAGALATVDATESGLPRERAHGHFWTPDGPIPVPEKQLSFLVGAGSLWSTPADLFKVVRRLSGGGYSGADAGARSANGAIQWTGFSNGFFAVVDYDPATDVTLILTSNLLTGAVDWIRRDVPRLLAGDTVPAPHAAIPVVVALSPDRRAQLEGVYTFGGNRQQLAFLSPIVAVLGGEYVLLATGDRSFFAPQNYAEYSVTSDSAGVVTGLVTGGPNGFTIPRAR